MSIPDASSYVRSMRDGRFNSQAVSTRRHLASISPGRLVYCEASRIRKNSSVSSIPPGFCLRLSMKNRREHRRC